MRWMAPIRCPVSTWGSGFSIGSMSSSFGAPLTQALANGTVPHSRLQDMVHRILRSMLVGGLFDDPPVVKPPQRGKPMHWFRSMLPEQAIVLLKNDHAQLPLSANVKTIAIIGGHADAGVLSGGVCAGVAIGAGWGGRSAAGDSGGAAARPERVAMDGV